MVGKLIANDLLQSAVIDVVTRFDQRNSLLVIHYLQSFSNQSSIGTRVPAVDLKLTQIDTFILHIATRQFCNLACPPASRIVYVISSLSPSLDSVLIFIVDLLALSHA